MPLCRWWPQLQPWDLQTLLSLPLRRSDTRVGLRRGKVYRDITKQRRSRGKSCEGYYVVRSSSSLGGSLVVLVSFRSLLNDHSRTNQLSRTYRLPFDVTPTRWTYHNSFSSHPSIPSRPSSFRLMPAPHRHCLPRRRYRMSRTQSRVL